MTAQPAAAGVLPRALPPWLAAHVTEVLDRLPSTGRGFADVSLGPGGLEARIGHTVGRGWQLGAFGQRTWSGRTAAGLTFRGRW